MKLLTAVVLFSRRSVCPGHSGESARHRFEEHLCDCQERRSSFRRQDSRRRSGPSSRPRKSAPSAQLFAHIADAQYEFCGVVTEGKSVSKDIEKTLKTKAEIVPR